MLVLGNGDSATSLAVLSVLIPLDQMAPCGGVLGGAAPSLGANDSKLRLAMILGVGFDSVIVDITDISIGHMNLDSLDKPNGPLGPRLLPRAVAVLFGAQHSELVGTFIAESLSLSETPSLGLLRAHVRLDPDHVPDPVGSGFEPVPQVMVSINIGRSRPKKINNFD